MTTAPPTTLGSASLRLVNLFAVPGVSSTVDVYRGANAADGAILVRNLPFGNATDYLTVPAGNPTFAVYRTGSTAVSDRIGWITPQLHTAAVVTAAITAVGDAQMVFVEVDPSPAAPLAPPPSGSALVIFNSTALVVPLATNSDSFAYGTPGQGCLRRADQRDELLVGGRDSATIVIAPGHIELAVYPAADVACAGAPIAMPISFDATAAGRTLVLAYGTGPADLHLLALPLTA